MALETKLGASNSCDLGDLRKQDLCAIRSIFSSIRNKDACVNWKPLLKNNVFEAL
jgi:hypothetical protein